MRDCADKVPVKIAEPATDAGREALQTMCHFSTCAGFKGPQTCDCGVRKAILSVESQARTRGAELATEAVRRNQRTEIVWFLEHNPNASDADIIDGVLLILGIER